MQGRRRIGEQSARAAGARGGTGRARDRVRARLRDQRRRVDQRCRRAPGLQPRAGEVTGRAGLPDPSGDLRDRPGPPHQHGGCGRRLRPGADRQGRSGPPVLGTGGARMGSDLGPRLSGARAPAMTDTTTLSADPNQPLRLLPLGDEPAGDVSATGLSDDDLRSLYRLMALIRRADLEATALQRQGELAVYPPLIGQEAAQIGSAFALEEADWIFPSYRELGAAVVRGVDLVEYLHFYRATWHGGTYDANAHRFGLVSVPVGSQILHAVGYAMGAKLDGHSVCSLVYFGDGATSEGDFHEGLNFAAVFHAPVIFFCQNNQWAISVPVSAQTVAPIWRKADAYGFPGVQVDGNDVLAVYKVTKDAAARARDDGTPTLIEAFTYRIG